MTNNEAIIYEFLARRFADGKSMNTVQVVAQTSGVMGNMWVESRFIPTETNVREGAIGLCNWEKGRRVELQHFARTHNGKETDLTIQLEWFWYELTTFFPQVYKVVKALKDPRTIAAEIDAHYEVSDGSARNERESKAQEIFTNYMHPTKPPTTTPTRIHKVVKGDTLWALAVHYYGKGTLYTKIYNANKTAIGKDPDTLRTGITLVIPS